MERAKESRKRACRLKTNVVSWKKGGSDTMGAILMRAACFIAVIILGHLLRRIGFFKEDDFHVLSKMVLKITLPAAIVTSVAGKEIDPGMLVLCLLGFGGGVLYMSILYAMNLHASKEKRAFEVLNISGYNIGTFTMPFVQSFLGPAGMLATSLFDTGNSFVCLGGSYSIASMIKGGGDKFSFQRIVSTLLRSIPFDTYILMLLLNLLHIGLPDPVISFAGILGNANPFLAMLMLGVGFHLSGSREQIGVMARILVVRYGIAVVLAVTFFNLLPLELEYRQALAFLVFSPISAAVPAFTADLGEDFGLSSALNSISALISIGCIIIVLMLVM